MPAKRIYKKTMNYKFSFILGILILIIITHFHLFFNKNDNNDDDDNEKRKDFFLNFKQNMKKLKYQNNNNDNNSSTIFPPSTEKENNKNKRALTRDIYDAKTGNLLLSAKGELRIYPKAEEIPPSCGFGKLHFNATSSSSSSWTCVCSEPDFFGGIYCDEPQKKMILKHKCIKVGYINNLENTDISTFNPFTDGVCVECSTKNAIPNFSSIFPSCDTIQEEDDDEEEEEEEEDLCFRDIINFNFKSKNNKYVKGYGCVCDYYNGFVEVNVGGRGDINSTENSNGCLKIGKTTTLQDNDNNYYHKTHIAFHTLKNMGYPKQVHEYSDLEQPYKSLLLFGKNQSLLVDQPARDVVHKQDWLNRCIKPSSEKEKISRLNHKDEWDIVRRKGLFRINRYSKRKHTHPISALILAFHYYFDPKHWTETTNQRYLKNAIFGHPIIYGTHDAKDERWRNNCTLNPLGTRDNFYYGITMLYKPGKIVRLDTRGDESDNVVVIPPNHKEEMINPPINESNAKLFHKFISMKDC